MVEARSSTNWRHIAELLAILSVVLSLIFVGYELRLTRRVAFSEGIVGGNSLMVEVSGLIAEHPDIWRRGCLGEELSPEDEIVFAQIHIANWDLWRTLYVRNSEAIAIANPELFARFVAKSRFLFPGYNDMYVRNIEMQGLDPNSISTIGIDFTSTIERLYQGFIESNEEIVADVAFCGRG